MSGQRDRVAQEDIAGNDSDRTNGERQPELYRSENGSKGAISITQRPPSPSMQDLATTPTPGAIDPLSQQILRRTITDHTVPERLRNPTRPESPSADGLLDFTPKQGSPLGESWSKRGTKGASFLSRLSMPGRSKKKDDVDSESVSDLTTDGASARVFSQAIAAPGAGGGYIPQHKEPPRYIRTKAYNKKTREFSRMFLAQELLGTRPLKAGGAGEGSVGDGGSVSDAGNNTVPLTGTTTRLGGIRAPQQTGGAIWATEFSKDGKYLAAGGRDHIVRVWAVISTAEERKAQEEEEVANGVSGERLSAPVFMEKPYREFEGHTGEILDLSWSKNNFLLSSSMDKTVRLWHITRNECLCTFKHKDFVTRLAFHPRDDRFFLAGSLDSVLRLWCISDKNVSYSVQLPDLITAVAFSPDGKTSIAGLLNGLCMFYDTEGLKYQDQIHVRSTRGKNAKGSKITGISTVLINPKPSVTASRGAPISIPSFRTSSDLASMDNVKVLVTSNDSRIRIYNMRDKTLETKFKGHENACSQIAASFSDDGRYIISGSEDRKAFIWNAMSTGVEENRDKKPYEYFDAHPEIVTTAIFAPTKTRILLNGGGDPIFELCNPPPVTLMSLEEAASAASSQVGADEVQTPKAQAPARKPEESPAYIARSTHHDGQIIVTTDDTGIIKVFRQDCAFVKRRHDIWETASSTFGRKQSQNLGGGFSINRSASIISRNSASTRAHSRRGSLSHIVPGPSPGVTSPQLSGFNGNSGSDRILSWRQGIEGNGSHRPASSVFSNPSIAAQVQERGDRSLSPSKSRPQLTSTASEAREHAHVSTPTLGRPGTGSLASPSTSNYGSLRGGQTAPQAIPSSNAKDKKDKPDMDRESSSPLPTPSFSFVPAGEEDDPLTLDPAGASYSFWNLNKWRSIAGRNTAANAFRSGTSPKDGSNHSRSKSRSSIRGEDLSPGTTPSPGARDTKRPGHHRRQPTAILSPSPSSDVPFESQQSLSSQAQTPTLLTPPIPSIKLPESEAAEVWPAVSSPDLSPYDGSFSRGNSVASRLTSELNFEQERGRQGSRDDGEEDEMRCTGCGGQEFKARRAAGAQVFSCKGCGRVVK
jgi:WD40 repeat protein